VLTLRGTGRAALDGTARAVPLDPGTDGAAALDATARRAAGAAPDASLVILVSGPHPAYLTLQRAAGRFAVDTARMAIRVQSGAPAGIRSDGDLTVGTISRLEELALVLTWGLR
jgi:hypothetical protein